MNCPRCGNTNLHPITESQSNVKGFGFGKGCLGYLLFGPIGWLCGLCGMGKGRTRTSTYWACGNCGHKFRT